MEEQQKPDQPSQEKEKKSRSPIVPILIVVLLVVAGLVVYNYLENKKLEEEKAAQEVLIEQTYAQLDSITNQLNDKIITISQLGGEIDTLLKIREKLETERQEFRTRAFRQINDLQERVDGYKELLVAQDIEIDRLKEINEELVVENTTLKEEKNELNESLRDLNVSKTELEEKVAIAGRLGVEGLQVFAVAENGKEREGEFRSRHINKLKIDFYIEENQVAPIEGKDILVRIIAPDRNVLFDVTRGSGSFMFEGREMFFTAKQEILYDRQRQKMTYYYEKGSDYQSGQHLVEVYTDDYLMGKGSFTVK
ncbi:MAG: chromosome segregation protein SMC [Cyclobacteriaceae bacterium]